MKKILLLILIGFFVQELSSPDVLAQNSSISVRKKKDKDQTGPEPKDRNETKTQGKPKTLEVSWTSVKPDEPKKYKPNDLITIIVREQRQFQADAQLIAEKDYSISSEIEAFLKFTRGGLGSSDFSRGRPNVDYSYEQELEGRGNSRRQDLLTTRITAKIVDVKPNGTLVIQATTTTIHDDEKSTMTLTGTCRKEDITADNTVLSTQMAEKVIDVQNDGAIKETTTRGWIPKLLDLLKPF